MKTKVFSLMAYALLGAMFIACSSDDKTEIGDVSIPEEHAELTMVEAKTRMDISLSAEESKVNDAANLFSLRFFNQAVDYLTADSNIVVSPFSAQAALAMTANGAREETLNEMLEVLNMKDFGLDGINSYNQTVIKAIADLDNTTTIQSANGIWSRVNLLQSFSGNMQTVFDARIEKTDFSPSAIAAIDDWAKEKTHGMVPKIIGETEDVSLLAMLLANALYFNGVWHTPFLQQLTTKGTFTNADRSACDLDMMQESGYKNYLDCGTFTLCEKPYGNEAFSMVFLLPRKDAALSGCIGEMAKQDWKALIARLSSSQRLVEMTVPKFELKDLSYDLKPIFERMGMNLAFTSFADFRNMTDESSLYISQITQKTAIMLNEQGTQAAAITKVEASFTSNGEAEPVPVEFTLNRPFAFFIKEKSTGIILFAGIVSRL